MSELTRDDIKEMVKNFIRSYLTEIDKQTLPEANQSADNYLSDLSREMTEDQTKIFIELAAPEVHKVLQAKDTEELEDANNAD